MEPYRLDLDRLTLERFFELTQARKMIPSRITLHEAPKERYRLLKAYGIETVGQLVRSLGTRQKIQQVASDTGIPVQYLVLLKREAGSYQARPVALSDFPGIPFEFTEVLKSIGIVNSKAFFEGVQTDARQKEVSVKTGIPVSRLKEILCLCDLTRITGVGGLFARIIYHAGIHSLQAFAETAPAEHRQKYRKVAGRYGYPDKPLSEEDITYCIDYANVILEFT